MKNYLEFKNYIGTVEFSADDKVFWGKIHGTNDLVNFMEHL
jgi:predicted HicB family RNase H-like nuclease